MFTHHNNPGKCEWIGGALDAFAQYYNEKSATNYTLTKCLDIIAIVGTTPKEPEVLLTDKSNSRKMVIERKSVVWPKSYIYRHELEHEFANLIWEGAKGFSDAGYRLSVEMRDFNKLTGMRIREAGKQIVEEISRLTGVSNLLCKRPGFVVGDGVQGKGAFPLPLLPRCRTLLRFHDATLSRAGIRSGHRIVKWFSASRQ